LVKKIPALFTNISTHPNLSITSLKRLLISSIFEISDFIIIYSEVIFLISFSNLLAFLSSETYVEQTFIHDFTNSIEIASHIHLVPQVTIATLFFNSICL
jgi:hypothetical protein